MSAKIKWILTNIEFLNRKRIILNIKLFQINSNDNGKPKQNYKEATHYTASISSEKKHFGKKIIVFIKIMS